MYDARRTSKGSLKYYAKQKFDGFFNVAYLFFGLTKIQLQVRGVISLKNQKFVHIIKWIKKVLDITDEDFEMKPKYLEDFIRFNDEKLKMENSYFMIL